MDFSLMDCLILSGVAALYFLPTLIALINKNPQWSGILSINFLFGWTFIGWFIACGLAQVDFKAREQAAKEKKDLQKAQYDFYMRENQKARPEEPE